MNWQSEDTIAAIATPFGVGGVGMIRLSGLSRAAISARSALGYAQNTVGRITRRMRICSSTAMAIETLSLRYSPSR